MGSAQGVPDEFSLLETMLWDDGYPLIELHLDRLLDSAEYFGIACERGVTESALMEYARGFESGPARRVRMLVDRDGQISIGDQPLAKIIGGEAKLASACIAQQRTDSKDAMLFHKTTYRPLYVRALNEAVDAGFDDVLFMNERGEVTEGAISNIFVEKGGRWLTSPVGSGLLAGVYRRHLMETLANAEEKVLRPEDLRQADAVYLCNAVRGLRKAEIDWNA